MKKIKVMSIKIDGVTIQVSDRFECDQYILVVMGFKGSMVEFMTLEIIDNKYYDLDLPVTYCDAKALLQYERVRKAA